MKSSEVYRIRDFRTFSEADGFYANHLNPHIRLHDFTSAPHKHDFFFLALFTQGSGIHEVDFKKYLIKPGSLFVLRPGQMHNWKISSDCDGYVFFHTGDFYDTGFNSERVRDYAFYSSHQRSPLLILNRASQNKFKNLLEEITEEYFKEQPLRHQKLQSLVKLVYIELSRLYHAENSAGKENYLIKLSTFEKLIDEHFMKLKSAGEYARLMHLSEKHLNRISVSCLGKTSTQLIADRIVLEAKRRLIHSGQTVSQIANHLGYSDNSYFTRFFRKHTRETPMAFLKRYRL